MRYNTRKWNPFLIAIPDIGLGMFWSLSGTIGSWIAYLHTNSATEVGMLISMSALLGIFVQVLSGMISDRTNSRFGKRTPWILLALFGACFFQMLWAFVDSFWMLMIVAFFTYFFVNFYQAPYYTMIVEVVDKDQIQFATMLARTTAQVGTIVVGAVAAVIWAAGGALLSTIVIVSVMLLTTIVVIPFVVKEKKDNYAVANYRFSLNVFSDKRINLVFAATFCVLFAFGAYIPLMASYMNHYLLFSESFTSSLVLTFGIFCVIAGFLATVFLSNYSPKWLMFVGMLLFALALLYASFVHSESGVFYAISAVVAIGFILCQVSCYTLVSILAPKGRLGEYLGWLNLFFSLPQFIIMIVGGLFVDMGYGGWIYPIAVILLLLGALMLLRLPSDSL
ncbi:MFS transporter [Fangia hongkongensis]|uniref:MFS transporter n=1 Tax=Fangia hongkongensis TaxID=270495 RepID=UPI00037A45E0|nr:MFS transporter [Fangia hongkongensis]MBK2125610.1 MFS transporter [Fangia hongkongensis]